MLYKKYAKNSWLFCQWRASLYPKGGSHWLTEKSKILFQKNLQEFIERRWGNTNNSHMPSHMPDILPGRSQSHIPIICEKYNWSGRYRTDTVKKKEEKTVFGDVLNID